MAAIIPLFIPHEGCPHACIFCNQHHNRPGLAPITPLQARAEIAQWLTRLGPKRRDSVEVAFYGGSFTALPAERQRALLQAVQPFLAAGKVQSIRLSTRPDYIAQDQLQLLRRYGVRLIELGVQSCDDTVLLRAGRGHSYADSLRASRLIRAAGLRLGWQLMPGMPGEGFAGIRRMAAACIKERPDCIRIYPLLVLKGSRLAQAWQHGAYQPLSLNRAVLYCAYLKKRFEAQGLPVIRMGLQASPALEQALLAGPYHPAFGELVQARLMLKKTRKLLSLYRAPEPCTLRIAAGDISIFTGMHRSNLKRLETLGLRSRFILVPDPSLPRQSLRLEV